MLLKIEVKYWRQVINKVYFLKPYQAWLLIPPRKKNIVKSHNYQLLHCAMELQCLCMEVVETPTLDTFKSQPAKATCNLIWIQCYPTLSRWLNWIASPGSFQLESFFNSFSNRSTQMIIPWTISNINAEFPKNEHDSIRKKYSIRKLFYQAITLFVVQLL